jgi:hypothetical protein
MTSVDEALAHAVRLLHAAELDTDRDRMGYLVQLAQAWTAIAQLLTDREEVE